MGRMYQRVRTGIRGLVSKSDPRTAIGQSLNMLNLSWAEVSGVNWQAQKPRVDFHPSPGLLTQHEMLTPEFGYWMHAIKEEPRWHRKQWEYFFALQSVWAKFSGELEGKTALVFGAGFDPIPALLASLGVQVLITDYRTGPNAEAWAKTNQLSLDLGDFNSSGICPESLFLERCSYQDVDMNAIPDEFAGRFDMVFSFCALGHIGSYDAGLRFVRNSARALRSGGIGVHTTELDFSRELPIMDTPNLSLYREENLDDTLRSIAEQGFLVPRHRFTPGRGFLETYLDRPPYGTPHLRVDVLGHQVSTFAFLFERP